MHNILCKSWTVIATFFKRLSFLMTKGKYMSTTKIKEKNVAIIKDCFSFFFFFLKKRSNESGSFCIFIFLSYSFVDTIFQIKLKTLITKYMYIVILTFNFANIYNL